MKKHRTLFGLLIIAGMMAFSLFFRNPHIGGDGLSYVLPMHNFVGGQGYILRGEPMLLFPPGYGVLAYIVFLFVRDIEFSAMLVSVIGYLLMITVVYAAAQYIFNKRTAFLAAFFVTFSPTFVHFGYVTLSDMIFTFFFVLCFGLYLRMILGEQSVTKNGLLGVLFGIAYLIRPEAFLVVLLGIAALIVVRVGERRQQQSWTPIVGPLAMLLAFLVVVSPYIWFMHEHTDVWTFSHKTTYNLLIGEKVVEGPLHVDRLQLEHPEYFEPGYRLDVVDYIQSRGGKYINRIITNLKFEILYFGFIMFLALVPFGLLVGISLFLKTGRLRFGVEFFRRNGRITLAFLIFLSPVPVLLFFFLQDRFLLPYAALILILLAAMIDHMLTSLDSKLTIGNVRYGLIAVCAISLLSVSGVVSFLPLPSLYETVTRKHNHFAIREAGLWIAENDGNGEEVTTISPRKGGVLLFYAVGKVEPQSLAKSIEPDMALEEVAQFVADNEFDYFVLDNFYLDTREQVLPLWNDPDMAVDFGIQLLHHEPGVFQVYGSR